MNDIRDYGIAVSDAVRLNDCYRELSEALKALPAIDGDEEHYFQGVWATPGNEEWVHSVNSRNVAEIVIRKAILERTLPIWIRLADRDELVDGNAINKVEHNTLAAGAYLTYNQPKSFLEGRPLWIKRADWERFHVHVLSERCDKAKSSALSEMFNIWLGNVPHQWAKARDDVNSEFALMGRVQSTSHVKCLAEICGGSNERPAR